MEMAAVELMQINQMLGVVLMGLTTPTRKMKQEF